jgi:hypothetical protein
VELLRGHDATESMLAIMTNDEAYGDPRAPPLPLERSALGASVPAAGASSSHLLFTPPVHTSHARLLLTPSSFAQVGTLLACLPRLGMPI